MRDKGRKIFLFWRYRIYRDDRAQVICLKHATLLQVFREPGRTWSNLREQGPTVLHDSKDPDLECYGMVVLCQALVVGSSKEVKLN